jgi:phage terminase large subunit-like protein
MLPYAHGNDVSTLDLVEYLADETAETFDFLQYLRDAFPDDAEWEAAISDRGTIGAQIRRSAIENDPLLFAALYLRHHLSGQETRNHITFSDFHLDLCRHRNNWMAELDTPAAIRDAYVAPRGCGKSTWLFLIMPMWVAALQYRKFAAAFADSGVQAEQHLETFKKELDENDWLRNDFPELCKPLTKSTEERKIADNRRIIQCSNGFIFAARGIEAASLGMKVGNLRPDLLILDDIEPGEETYSAYQARKRLLAVTDNVFPLNVNAQVVMVGTTTMSGSIMHQIIRVGMGEQDDSTAWVRGENIDVHYYEPILTREDGSERSLWPAKWGIDFLNSIRHTRAYAKNFANLPVALDGDYWGEEDFPAGEVPGLTRYLLSVDPAVTSKKSSDFTGLSVVAYSPSAKRAQVMFTVKVRLSSKKLRPLVLQICQAFPIKLILVESNQGGDLWEEAFEGIPGTKVTLIHQTDHKEVRAARFLAHCQAMPPRVLFGPDPKVQHSALREEAMSFPHGLNDDLVDSTGTGLEYFLKWATAAEAARHRAANPIGRAVSYVRSG